MMTWQEKPHNCTLDRNKIHGEEKKHSYFVFIEHISYTQSHVFEKKHKEEKNTEVGLDSTCSDFSIIASAVTTHLGRKRNTG